MIFFSRNPLSLSAPLPRRGRPSYPRTMAERLEPSEENLRRAGECIARGGLVALPTETVYGLGADAFDARAVARVFEAKARPSFDPLIVHVASIEGVDRVAEAPARRPAPSWKRSGRAPSPS